MGNINYLTGIIYCKVCIMGAAAFKNIEFRP